MQHRALAWSGLLYAVTILVGTLLALPSGISEREMEWSPPSTYMPGIAAAQPTFVASMWVFHASSIALAVFGLASGHRWTALFLGMSGGAFLIETTAILGMGTGIAPAYATATGADATRLESVATALIAFRVHMALLASLLLALGGLALGAATWRDGTMPRALAALALASGVVGLLGGLSLMFEPFSLVRTTGILLWTAFAGFVGIRAFVRPTSPRA